MEMTNRVLSRLGQVNSTVAFLVTAVLVITALVVGGWFGALVLLGMFAGLVRLLVRVWPALDSRGRAGRVGVLTLLAFLGIAQLLR
jgi:hypothetical protein